MNNRIAKLLALLLCVVMVASLFTGCVEYSDEGNEFPINYDIDLTQKPTLNVLMPNSGRDIDAVNSDNTALLIQQLTGYEVKYTQLPAADSSKVLNNELMEIPHSDYILQRLVVASSFNTIIKKNELTIINGIT